MGRYNTTTAMVDANGKRRAETTILNIPISSNDIFIKTTSYERLDKLAETFYGDVSDWYIIAAANGLGKGSIWVPQDTILLIPRPTNITEHIKTINGTR